MNEFEKLLIKWEKLKPKGTEHERIWNGFINDLENAIKRSKVQPKQ